MFALISYMEGSRLAVAIHWRLMEICNTPVSLIMNKAWHRDPLGRDAI